MILFTLTVQRYYNLPYFQMQSIDIQPHIFTFQVCNWVVFNANYWNTTQYVLEQ